MEIRLTRHYDAISATIIRVAFNWYLLTLYHINSILSTFIIKPIITVSKGNARNYQPGAVSTKPKSCKEAEGYYIRIQTGFGVVQETIKPEVLKVQTGFERSVHEDRRLYIFLYNHER